VVTRLSPTAVGAGVSVGFIVTLISAGILALILALTPVTEKALAAVVSVMGALSVFAGGFAAARRSGGRGWLHGGVTGCAYAAACFLVGLIFFPGLMPPATLPRRLILGFGIGLIGGITALNF
jgi:putative membrane protein (TIGR04086 family)